ncbi:hypothetical protein AALO_G00132590 [Alosa alosa]|uniref:Paralemmin-1 n=1 Tax=Alosa alosa TaxID=278164 RepID=A0AAV6GS34_9TELE|nr:hypothetical protein AALO_G00132590 [Alosa alosa]
MEMSEALSQQERLQAIAEKRKRQTEIENKKRQLEDDRRQLQHLKSKALRERWLLDGVPSGGPEEDAAKKQLQEDEAKTRALEETINRMEQELQELETGVSATSTKDNLSDATKEESNTTDSIVSAAASVKEVKVQHKVHHSPRLVKSGDGSEMMRAVVHEVRGGGRVVVVNGAHQLSSSEVEELILKADEVVLSPSRRLPPPTPTPTPTLSLPLARGRGGGPPMMEIRGMETMRDGGGPEVVAVGNVSAENPVTMVFMGYQSVEDEAETNKVLGLRQKVGSGHRGRPEQRGHGRHSPPHCAPLRPKESETAF